MKEWSQLWRFDLFITLTALFQNKIFTKRETGGEEVKEGEKRECGNKGREEGTRCEHERLYVDQV